MGLVGIVIDLDPVAIGVFEIDLFYPIHPFGDGIGPTVPVLVGDLLPSQLLHELCYRRYTEAKVGMTGIGGEGVGAGDEVQVSPFAYAEPGMAAIAERLGNGIQSNDIAVEAAADGQVADIKGNMVEDGGGR